MPENREEAREDRKVNLELGVTTREEERSQMGLEFIEGTDELLIPAGVTRLEDVGEESDDELAERANRIYELARGKRG